MCRKLQPIHQMSVFIRCGRIIAVPKWGAFDAMPQVATNPPDVVLDLLWKDYRRPKTGDARCYAASCNPSIRCGSCLVVEGSLLSEKQGVRWYKCCKLQSIQGMFDAIYAARCNPSIGGRSSLDVEGSSLFENRGCPMLNTWLVCCKLQCIEGGLDLLWTDYRRSKTRDVRR